MVNFQRYNLPGNGITCRIVKVWDPCRHHTWPQQARLVSRLMTVYQVFNMSLYVDTCIYQSCLSSCHDKFDNCGREYEEVFPQLSQHKKTDSHAATDAAPLSVLIALLTFLGRFRSAGFLPHSMLEPVLKTDVCLTARDAPSTNPEKYISLSIQHVR
jgi:hypothetical protein